MQINTHGPRFQGEVVLDHKSFKNEKIHDLLITRLSRHKDTIDQWPESVQLQFYENDYRLYAKTKMETASGETIEKPFHRKSSKETWYESDEPIFFFVRRVVNLTKNLIRLHNPK